MVSARGRLALAMPLMLMRGLGAVSFVGQRMAHSSALRQSALASHRHFASRAPVVCAAAVEALADLEARVREQGNLVRTLKTEGGDEAAVSAAVAELVALKAQLPEGHELLAGGKKKKKAKPEGGGGGGGKKKAPAFDPAVGPSMDEVINVCKRRGIIFQSSEIYGGFAGFFDYGPLGVELRANIKKAWWQDMIQRREDMVGLDSSIIASPKVWAASGHLDGFSDPMVDCKESKVRTEGVPSRARDGRSGWQWEDVGEAGRGRSSVLVAGCARCHRSLAAAHPCTLARSLLRWAPTALRCICYIRYTACSVRHAATVPRRPALLVAGGGGWRAARLYLDHGGA